MLADLEGCYLSDEEYAWLQKTCPYFDKSYLDFLHSYRFNPKSQVHLRFTPSRHGYSLLPPSSTSQTTSRDEDWGDLEIVIEGNWAQTILYEVPILAIISESYFATVDTSWDYTGQISNSFNKTLSLLEAGCAVTDFGTRRRRSYRAQDLVIKGIVRASTSDDAKAFKGRVGGTSNVHFAMKYGLTSVGTIAHEMIMATAAMEGYEGSNGKVLDMWEELYKGDLTIALTDTFSTSASPLRFVLFVATCRVDIMCLRRRAILGRLLLSTRPRETMERPSTRQRRPRDIREGSKVEMAIARHRPQKQCVPSALSRT